jgi:hypothetical protein
VCPDGMSVYARCRETLEIEAGDDVRELWDVERNLRGLTMGVPSMCLRDIPHHLQRHVVGVSEGMSHLLCRVAREVTYYHEHHAPQED